MKDQRIEMYPKPQVGQRFVVTSWHEDTWMTKILVKLGLMRPAGPKVEHVIEVTDENGGYRFVD